MPRSIVRLPAQVQPPFKVFISGVPQVEGTDSIVEDDVLVFPDRELRKDKISGWRWFLGAWGVGTYRQNDEVDVQYESGGRPRVAEALPIELSDD